MRPGLGRRLNKQMRDQEAGNRKLSEATVRAFKRRRVAGESIRKAAAATGIKPTTAADIASGKNWSWVILLVLLTFTLLGAKSCPVAGNNYEVNCQGMNYPLCRDVPYDYPCLCLETPDGVSSAQAQALRHLND